MSFSWHSLLLLPSRSCCSNCFVICDADDHAAVGVDVAPIALDVVAPVALDVAPVALDVVDLAQCIWLWWAQK